MSGGLPNNEFCDGSAPLLGTVLAVQANFYQVRLENELNVERLKVEGSTNQSSNLQPAILLCTRRSRLKKLVNG